MTDYEILPVTKDVAEWMWPRLRKMDLEEAYAQGAKNLYSCMKATHNGTLFVDGEPVCIFWMIVHGQSLFFCFVGTDKVRRHWRFVHKFAVTYLKLLEIIHPTLSFVVYVWEGHKESLKWLDMLGFKKTPDWYIRNGYKMLVLEKR